MRLEEEVRRVLTPLRAHRDKVVAHWDPGPLRPATWGDLTDAFLELEQLFSRLWVVHTREIYLIEARSPHSRESTAEILANAIQR